MSFQDVFDDIGKTKASEEANNFKANYLKTIFLKNLAETSFHAVNNIYHVKDIFLKSVLVVCFLTSSAFLCYLTVKTFIDYFAYGVLTSNTVASNVPTECIDLLYLQIIKAKFCICIIIFDFQNKVPVVAFCNLNAYDYTVAYESLNNITNDGTIDQFNSNYTARGYTVLIRRYMRYNLMKKHLSDMRQLYRDGFGIDQMLISCNYQSKQCSMNDFMYHYDFFYGLCWRFNAGKGLQGNDLPIRTAGQVGWKNGLQLELYAGHAELQERLTLKRGFRVLVFNKSTVFPIADEIGIDVSTGQETNIGIKRTFVNHLPDPFSNCLPTDINQID
jgi:hypothetical protein